MAEKNPPVWMQSGTYNALDDRMVTGLLSDIDRGAAGNGSGILGGVIPGWEQLAVTAPGSTMQVNVSAGGAVIPSVGTTPPGAYIVYNEGVKPLTLDIESSANPRIDVVYADVDDQAVGDLTSEWRIAVKKGLPSASPTRPTLASGQIALAQVLVKPASQNGGVNKVTAAQLTDLRRMLTGLGGVHVTKSGIPNPNHAPGRILYDQSQKSLFVSDGASWKLLYTYDQWLSYFAAYRPRHTAISSSGTIATGAANNKKWIYTLKKTTGSGNNPGVQTTVKSPSGSFKVTISSYGKTNDNAGGNGHVSVRVRQGATAKFNPDTGWRSIGFYSRNWEHHGTSFLVSGMPANTDLVFELAFMRNGPDANTVTFQTCYLMVEPVL